ncbi:MAG TPA: hypothetical protein VGQ17_06170 [Gemmatimonadales bacterium]|jgi:hypothetical protein|nr:hypothetical protein [Gemmatimonadales bacterium]
MSWWRERFGIDGVDLLIQGALTGLLMASLRASGGPSEVAPMIAAASLLVLGVRRYFALRSGGRRGLTTGEMAAERLAELEQRMADLEAAHARVAELEERLDFAERMLAQTSAERQAIPRGSPP